MKDIKFSDFLNSLTDDDFAQMYSDGNLKLTEPSSPWGMLPIKSQNYASRNQVVFL